VEVWNLDDAVSSILPGKDEIEGGQVQRLEVLHVLGITSTVV
jgi:hypothetical protein